MTFSLPTSSLQFGDEERVGGSIKTFLRSPMFRDAFGARSAVFPSAFAYHDLQFDWSSLNDILADHRTTDLACRFSHLSKAIPESDYIDYRIDHSGSRHRSLSVGKFVSQLDKGATFVLDHVDLLHSSLRRVSRTLMAHFGCRVNANLYASFKNDEGFGPHWDSHDVLVFQLIGRKRWKLFGPTVQDPRRIDIGHIPRPDLAVFRESVIKSSDILYVPRGHWHDVSGCDGPSLHVTFGIFLPTASEIVSWVLRDTPSSDVRKSAPLVDAPSRDRAAYENDVRNSVMTSLSPGFLTRFLNYARERNTSPFSPSLPWSIDNAVLPPEIVLVWVGIGTCRLNGAPLVLTAGAKSIEVDVVFRPGLSTLVGRGKVSLSEFTAKVGLDAGHPALKELVSKLTCNGFCELMLHEDS